MVVVHGTGSIGTRHLRVLERMGVAACGLSARSGQALPDARAAIVCTNTGRHIADASAAMSAGMHVLVEKPVASNTAGLAALGRLARDKRRHLYVACCLRFDAALLAFRAQLPSIGRVRDVRVECRSWLPDWRPGVDYRTRYSARADEGGVLRDLVHEIDYASWLFGWPTKLVGRVGNTGQLEIESEEWAELEWTTDAHVSMRLDYITRQTRRVMRAEGEHGFLEVDLVAQTVTSSRGTEKFPQERDDMFRDQTAAFLAAIDGGDAKTLATFEDGARAIAICDAARVSNGSEIAIANWRAA